MLSLIECRLLLTGAGRRTIFKGNELDVDTIREADLYVACQTIDVLASTLDCETQGGEAGDG